MNLRPMTRDDLPLLTEWMRTGAVGSEVSWRKPNPLLESKAVMVEVGHLPIGSVVLFNVDRPNRTGEIGVYVADQEYRGAGMGLRALRIVLNGAYDKVGLERIEAQTLHTNKPVNEQLQRAGFVREGTRRKAAIVDGIPRHIVVWSMLKHEFDARWRR